MRQRAQVVVTGRDQAELDALVTAGSAAAVRVDRPHDDLAADIAAHGPYNLAADFLWGAPAEAAFAALADAGAGPQQTRYILVGMAARETASLPAMALRRAPIHLFGSGSGKPLSFEESGAAYGRLLGQVAGGDITLDIDTVPLADIGQVWSDTASHRRIVLVP